VPIAETQGLKPGALAADDPRIDRMHDNDAHLSLIANNYMDGPILVAVHDARKGGASEAMSDALVALAETIVEECSESGELRRGMLGSEALDRAELVITELMSATLGASCAEDALDVGAEPRQLSSQEDALQGDYERLDAMLGRGACASEIYAFHGSYSARLIQGF
jgi:hypothetical protein